jgi:DNA (cytosine-5)-methyltransferase 1
VNVLDLFSGIGGFSLGLESTGFFKTIAFVEKDKFCQKVLRKNFPNIPIENDVRNVKGEKYRSDVVTGGFPCQPFSVAGKRRGTDDDRFLWDETIRIVSEQKPKWFIGENVEGIINIQDGMVFRQIHDDLESEGFETQSIIIPASGVGAWHQRKRVWIIGCNVSNSNTRQRIGENQEVQARGNTINDGSKDVSNTNSGMRGRWGTEQSSRANEVWRFCIEKEKQTQHDIRSKAVGCDALFGEEENVTNTNEQRTQVQIKGKHTSIEMSGSSSKETWWQTQSSLCRVPDGVSYELDKDRTNRIKSLGNSIVPQIAREIGKAIMEAEIG